jgi:hypothetical protein
LALYRGWRIALPISIIAFQVALVLLIWSAFLKRAVIPVAAIMSLIALTMLPTTFRAALGVALGLRRGYRNLGATRISRDERPIRFWLFAIADLIVLGVTTAAATFLVWFAVRP